MPTSLAVRNCDQLYIAHLNSISVCKLNKSSINISDDTDTSIISQLSTIFKTSFESTITDIKLNSTGTFLAVCTTSISSSQIHVIKLTQNFSATTSIRSIAIDDTVVDFCWHNLACYDSYLIILCNDCTIKCFDLSLSGNFPIDIVNLNHTKNANDGNSINLNMDEITNPVSFSFASANAKTDPIGCLTLLILTLEGDIYSLFPFQPSRLAIPEQFLPQWLNDTILQQHDNSDSNASPTYTTQLKYISAMMKQLDTCPKELRTSKDSSSFSHITELQLISPLIKNELLKLQGPSNFQNFPDLITNNFSLTATSLCNCKVGNLNILWVAYNDASLVALLYNNDSVMKLADEDDDNSCPSFITVAYKKLITSSPDVNCKVNLISSDVDSMFFAMLDEDQPNDQLNTANQSSMLFKVDCFEFGQWLNDLQLGIDGGSRKKKIPDISVDMIERKISPTIINNKPSAADYHCDGATVIVISEKTQGRYNKNDYRGNNSNSSYIIYKIGSQIKCKKFEQLKKNDKPQYRKAATNIHANDPSLLNKIINPSISMIDMFNNIDIQDAPKQLKLSIIENRASNPINCNTIGDKFVQKLLHDKQISDNLMNYFRIEKSNMQSARNGYTVKDIELWNILIISIIDKISDLFINELHSIFQVLQDFKWRSMFYKSILERQAGLLQEKIIDKIESSESTSRLQESFNKRFDVVKQRNSKLEKRLASLNSKLENLNITQRIQNINNKNPLIGTGENFPLSNEELQFVKFIKKLKITHSTKFQVNISKISQQFEFYKENLQKKRQIADGNHEIENVENLQYFVTKLRKDEEFIDICKNVVKKAIEDMEFEEMIDEVDND